MAQPSARRIALAALRRWRKEKRFADSVISEFLAKAELAYSDRAFALELFYGVLRNLTLLDFWIGCLRTSQIEADLRDVLRLGLYQLFFLDTAQHAAVYETVELVSKRQRAVINAMLRAAARQRNELLRPRRCAALIRSNFASAVAGRTVATAFRRQERGRVMPME